MNQTLPTRADQLPVADSVEDLEVFGLKDGMVHRLRQGWFQSYVNDETARRVEAGVAPFLDLIAGKVSPDDLAEVAKTGSYGDLQDRPVVDITDLAEKMNAVTYETLTALAEGDTDNEKAAVKRIFEPGGNMPFPSVPAAQAVSIPMRVKTVTIAEASAIDGGPTHTRTRVNAEPAFGPKHRSLDRYTADGDFDSSNGGWWAYVDQYGDRVALSSTMFGSVADAVAEALRLDRSLMLSPGEVAIINVPSQKATIQEAYDAIRKWSTPSGSAVVIQLADGTYTSGLLADRPGIPLTIRGNPGSPGNVIVSVTAAQAFQAQDGAIFTVDGIELRTATAGSCLYAVRGGCIYFKNIRFGACATTHIEAIQQARCQAVGDYAITGGALSHMHAAQGGVVLNSSNTVTITGTPTFTAYFIGVAGPGYAQCIGQTYVGNATGKRFLVHNSGFIDLGNVSGGLTAASQSTYFPGDVAGECNLKTGGVYDYITSPLALLNAMNVFASNVGVNGAPPISAFQVRVEEDTAFRTIDYAGYVSLQATNLAQDSFKDIAIEGVNINFFLRGGVIGLPALPNYPSDSVAAGFGLPVGAVYRNGSVLMQRQS